jgi:hypothetical protein
MFKKTVPVLWAVNITDTIEFYKCKLGFAATSFGNYAIVQSGAAEIHFCMADTRTIFEKGNCYIFTDNIEDLYADLSAKELIRPKNKLITKHRGYKEFSIEDNNGNTICFGQKI